MTGRSVPADGKEEHVENQTIGLASGRTVDVIHAHHTAGLVPGAKLAVFDDHGHFSIVTEVVPAIRPIWSALAAQLSAIAGTHNGLYIRAGTGHHSREEAG
jgi:hypothetical protein